MKTTKLTEINPNDSDSIKQPSKEEIVRHELVKDDNLERVIFDLEINIPTKIHALNRYSELHGFNNTMELISRLCNMFQFSGLKKMKNFLVNICRFSDQHIFIKLHIANFLCIHNEKDEVVFSILEILLYNLDEQDKKNRDAIKEGNIPILLKLDYIFTLKRCNTFIDKTINLLKNILNDYSLDDKFRFNILLKLQVKEGDTKNTKNTTPKNYNPDLIFCQELYPEYFFNENNNVNNRILAAQYMLIYCDFDSDNKERIESKLLEIARNENINYNTRADATDVVLQTARNRNKKEAENLILYLGSMYLKDSNINIYANAQNVHNKEIDDSVKEIIEKFNNFDVMVVNNKPITVNYVQERIMALLEEKESISYNKEYINVSFNRIKVDRMLYGSSNYNLSTILIKLWSYIQGHESKNELEKRLVQELQDMANTCSSGFCNRLINVLSGFTEFNIRISWQDQIKANVSGRLNAKIRVLDNLNLKEKIMEELASSSGEYNHLDHKNFLDFFKANIDDIKNEMYLEYKEHIDDVSFDFYFKIAIAFYQSGDDYEQ